MPTRSKAKRKASRKRMNGKTLHRPITVPNGQDGQIPINAILNGMAQSLSSVQFQVDTLLLLLQRKGVVTDDDIKVAGYDVNLRQQRIRSLLKVQGLPRLKGLVLWTKEGTGAPIHPRDVNADRILLDPKIELSGRDRAKFAMDLGFDQEFQSVVMQIEHDPEGKPVRAPYDPVPQEEAPVTQEEIEVSPVGEEVKD